MVLVYAIRCLIISLEKGFFFLQPVILWSEFVKHPILFPIDKGLTQKWH